MQLDKNAFCHCERFLHLHKNRRNSQGATSGSNEPDEQPQLRNNPKGTIDQQLRAKQRTYRLHIAEPCSAVVTSLAPTDPTAAITSVKTSLQASQLLADMTTDSAALPASPQASLTSLEDDSRTLGASTASLTAAT